MGASIVLWQCKLNPNTRAEKMLHAFEKKILRRSYGQIQEKWRWRPRWDSEIHFLCIGQINYVMMTIYVILKLED
jgi:hypothetical protein